MKTRFLYTALVAAALSTGVVVGDDTTKSSSDKSLGEKTTDTLKNTGRSIENGTKKAAESVGNETKKAADSIGNESKKVGESLKNAVTPESEWRKVDVTLTGRRIEMSREIQAGRTAFVVRNNGSERQNFKVEGEGLDKEFMIGVAPNDTKTLNIELKPGEYKVFVPKSGTKEEPKGHEELNLKVK